MKPSARVALMVALAMTAPTWASLPFYSPDYTFDSTTGTGYRGADYVWDFYRLVSPDGKAADRLKFHESNVYSHDMIAMWRGQTPLPTPQLDGFQSSARALAINRSGWICGYTGLDTSIDQAAMWRPDGTRIDLPHLSSSFPTNSIVSGRARDMNDAGIAVGYTSKFEHNQTRVHPVYWSPSGEVVELANPLAIPNQAWEGSAGGVSANGIIAGVVHDGNVHHAVKWNTSGSVELLSETTNTRILLTFTAAVLPLDDGTILGWGRNGTDVYAVTWMRNGEAVELRNLPNSTAQATRAYNINNNHYSVGSATDSSGNRAAVRWSSTGNPLVLDRLPDVPSNADDQAADINDLDFAVGWSLASPTFERAVLWTPAGDAIELNSLVESGSEWNFVSASTITNTGWISGYGKYDPTGPATAYRRPFSILVPFAGTYGMGDANFDESIDFADLLIVAQNYGTSTNGSFDVGDFNLDGSVNFTDLLAIAQNYGNVLGDATGLLPNSPNPTFESDWQAARGMVPEPGVVGLICLGLMLLTSRKRERRARLEIESNFGAWEFDRR